MRRRFRYNPTTDQVEEVGTNKPRSTNDWKQLSCENMGYDGSVEDAKRLDREYGAPEVDYVQVGPNSYNPVFNDRSTYNRYLKAHGFYNKTSGKSGANPIDGRMLTRAAARILERYKEAGTNGGLPKGDSGNIDRPEPKVQ